MPSKESPHAHMPHMKELTLRAISIGVFFGLLFAIVNAYLALKVGTTISASIPAAILAMSLMKLLFKDTTVLESNTVQTIATVGEGLAAGVSFTIPALILLGNTPSVSRIFLLSALGGILGILFMIPMRRFIIIKERRKLPFPEGTACATILKAGQSNNKIAVMASWGVLVGAIYKIGSNILFLWKETPYWTFFQKFQLTIEGTPSLLGVGYIIGPRITTLMFSGSIIAWWVFIPLIKIFGLGSDVVYPSAFPIKEMDAADIWNNYVRYIGAGTLIFGGLLSLVQIIPLIYRTLHMGLKELLGLFDKRAYIPRKQRDISLSWLLPGALAIILTLWLIPFFTMNFFTIVLLTVLGFFFVSITCFAVGLVGSSASPVSGMTITTLLITCLIFVLLGWTERIYLISAITMGCVTCCAICTAGTTAQDLKTGHLLGAMPRSQQLAELIGVLLPSLALGYIIYLLNQAYEIGSVNMPAPQATLMAMIAEGVIDKGLPYGLVGAGIVLGLVMTLLRIQILPFALGVYLPLSLTAAIMVGGLARAYVEQKSPDFVHEERGLLLASGLIGGDACIGIVIALMAVFHIQPISIPTSMPNWISLGIFLLLGYGLALFARKK